MNEAITMTKLLTLNQEHEILGAKMVPFAGYNMPLHYGSAVDEHHHVRNHVGMFDVSHMGEVIVKGPQAIDFVQWISSNDASKLKIGKAQYSCLPNNTGGIIDDLIVYQLEEQTYLLVINASNIEKDWAWMMRHAEDFDVELENISDEISLLAIQGPKAVELLQSLTPADLNEIPFYHFNISEVAGIEDIIISATGYTGAGGFELYIPNKNVAHIWEAILNNPLQIDIKPAGLAARDSLRLEMGYCLYGNDINDETSPLEAGLGWITKFSKKFVNSDHLLKQKEEGITKKLVGISMIEKGIPRQGYTIVNELNEEIGIITSGGHSPSLNKGIGLGYVQKEYAKAGSEIGIQIRNKVIKASVSKLPLLEHA